MSFDLIAAALLGLLVLVGMIRGFVPSTLGIVSLVVGYVGAIFGAKLMAAPLAEATGLPHLLALPIAGTSGFLGAMLGSALLSSPIRRWDRARARENGRGPLDRLGGGLMGGLRGALVVVLLALLVSWLDAARDLTGDVRLASVPDTDDSIVTGAAGLALETAVESAFGGEGAGTVAARIVARPGVSLQAVQSIAQHPAIQGIQSDSVFWMYVEQGQAHNAVHRPAFHQLVGDDELRQQLALLGAIDEEAAASPEAFRAHIEEALHKVGPKLRELRNDPELQELAKDPDILASLESGDALNLLADARLHRIASRVAEDL